MISDCELSDVTKKEKTLGKQFSLIQLPLIFLFPHHKFSYRLRFLTEITFYLFLRQLILFQL